MSEIRTFDEGAYRIEVTADALTATLITCSGVDISAATVVAKLNAIGITNFDGEALIAALQARHLAELSFVVARGVVPTDERPARVELRIPTAEAETGMVAKVTPGQLIATVASITPGTDGRDVFGQPIQHKKAEPFTPGCGVALDKGGLTTTIAGNARISDGSLGVYPLLELSAENEADKTPVVFNGDIAIKGSLRDGKTLSATGCFLVGGAVEAASFKIGGWTHVNGGIVGRDKGVGIVGGDLWCRFASGSRLTVTGNVNLQSEAANSRIACGGRLTVTRGPISGGEIAANGGITCYALGNPACTTTIVEAGTDQLLRTAVLVIRTEVEANRKRVAEVREKIAPLMQRLKSLTPAQKEKATELLFEADELEAASEAKLAGLTDRCQAAALKSRPEILVADTIHPGVIVRFPGVESLITSAIKGPIRIVPRKTGNAFEIVVEEKGKLAFPLAVTLVTDHFSPFVKQIAAEKLAA